MEKSGSPGMVSKSMQKPQKKTRPRRLDQALQNRLQDIHDDSLADHQETDRRVPTLLNQLLSVS